MTVEMQTQRAIHQGNGTATEFPFDFTVYGPEQVRVITADRTGKETERVPGVDFTVALAGTGGSVSYPLSGAPLQNGEKLVVCSAIPSTQERSFPNNTPLYQDQVEGGMDKAIRLIQQLEDGLSRAVLAPVSSEAGGGELYADELLQAADRAREAAESASVDADRAEDAAERAQTESGKILSLSVSAHASSNNNVAADYSPETGMLHLYIPRGEQGEIGPRGPSGGPGPQGAQGIEGPRGAQGIEGPRGLQGERGPQGIQGLQGGRGPVGETGAQGPRGETGPRGEPGPRGVKGDQGPAGPEGPRGATGDVTTALEASLLQFGVEPDGSLCLNYLGTADPQNMGSFALNPQTGELEVSYA